LIFVIFRYLNSEASQTDNADKEFADAFGNLLDSGDERHKMAIAHHMQFFVGPVNERLRAD